MFALEHDLRDHFGRDSRIATVLLGFGVMLPDVEFEAVGVEADRAQVYDVRDSHASLARWVRKLVDYTRRQQHSPRNGLGKHEMQTLVDYLRGDFSLIPSFDVTSSDVHRGLHRLTRQQATAVASFDRHARLIVKGAAGTGKSLLALEALRRETTPGKRTLLLCYNRLLAARLRAAASSIAGARVQHAHDFMRDVIAKSPVAGDFGRAAATETNTKRLYTLIYPQFASLALAGGAMEPFDTVIIDEAQDLLESEFVDVVDQALKGGVEQGRWRLFLDDNEQASIYGKLDDATLSRFERLGPVYLLPLNCRNTTQIHLATRAIARPRSTAMATHPGDHVERRWYDDGTSLTKQLRAVLKELSDRGVPPGCVTVLYASLTDDLEHALVALQIKSLVTDDVPRLGTKDLTQITHATASAFKGLENDVIIVAGIEKVDGDWWRAATYVGMSRARTTLYVLVHSAAKTIVDERFTAMVQEAMEESK